MKQGIIVSNTFSCVHMSAQPHLTTSNIVNVGYTRGQEQARPFRRDRRIF